MTDPRRVMSLNRASLRDGNHVLYWMQASQRAEYNHALEYAVDRANQLSLPVVACFGLTDDYPEANARHYAFLLEGLAETSARLGERGIPLVVRLGNPLEVALSLADEAALVVTDRGYLRHQVAWRKSFARKASVRVMQVESDAVVPVDYASDHAEYAARTLRKKHMALWDAFLQPLEPIALQTDALGRDFGGEDVSDPHALLERLDVDRTVPPSQQYHGGAQEGRRRLRTFLDDSLPRYASDRNDPSLGVESHMSPYLHFGQLSPVEIALAVRDHTSGKKGVVEGREAYLEELLIRRELALNFVRFTKGYDRYASLPNWAKTTLKAHRRDRRDPKYTTEELVASRTDDPYWNAAMTEMRLTGKMHNYMRMYWGKKVLEWTGGPASAYRRLLGMNNRWFLDGRDPVSFANVGWVFGLHDRPWQERAIFGTVRTMTAGGLERKFDIDGYVRRIADLQAGLEEETFAW